MKKAILILSSILAVLILIMLLQRKITSANKIPDAASIQESKKIVDSAKRFVDSIAQNAIMDSNSSKNEDFSNWNYYDEMDEMTSKKIYFAEVHANELVDLDFPYQGGVIAAIILRNKNKKTEAVLKVSKGQFNVSMEGEEIEVRFDDKKSKTFQCDEPSDGSTSTLFIHPASLFVSEMKKAKQVLVKAEFFSNGNKVMKFNVENLKWNY